MHTVFLCILSWLYVCQISAQTRITESTQYSNSQISYMLETAKPGPGSGVGMTNSRMKYQVGDSKYRIMKPLDAHFMALLEDQPEVLNAYNTAQTPLKAQYNRLQKIGIASLSGVALGITSIVVGSGQKSPALIGTGTALSLGGLICAVVYNIRLQSIYADVFPSFDAAVIEYNKKQNTF